MPRHDFYESASPGVARGARTTQRVLDAGAHFLLPAWCAGCDAALPWRPSPLGLCAACRAALPQPARHRCRRCGVALSPLTRRCAACARRPPSLDRLVAAWSYQPPIDQVIQRLKYRRLEFLADDLASGVASAVTLEAGRYDWVTGVPLHWRRRWGRGYDQGALLAAAVALRLGLAYRPLLVRVRSTPSQVDQSAAARRRNLAGAFRCRLGCASAIAESSILLVDDVATTGATLEAASLTLKAAGAAEVTGAVAALTPKRRR
jgi:ComF family protein